MVDDDWECFVLLCLDRAILKPVFPFSDSNSWGIIGLRVVWRASDDRSGMAGMNKSEADG
jgi:hypothetical protein